MEMKFYRDVILPQVESGQILYYELQKPYELQPKFTYNGKPVRAIIYVADFYVEYSDGRIIVFDTKGAADSIAKCKRKLFWYKYPDINYQWITYVKKYGGWIDWDKAAKMRKDEKKKKKELEESRDGEK